MNKRVMILGSLGEFLGLTAMAKERGIYTIVCDGNPDGPAKSIADKSYDIDVTDIEKIAGVCKNEKADGIITAFSDLLLECMVKISDKAGLPCYLKPDQLDYYRDKRVMKKMFRELGIGTPKFVSARPDFDEDILKDFKFPVIAKPVDKYGSRGITILNSIEEIRECFYKVCESSELKEILIEEYHDGFEFNVMSWLNKGELTILGLADREKTSIAADEIPISTRNIYPSRLYDRVIDEVKSILEKIAGYTGQTDGELSMQFFWKPGENIQVGEVAARFLGYEHELIEYAGGFSIEKLLIDSIYDQAAMEDSLKKYDPAMNRSAAVIYFQAKEGTVAETKEIDKLSELEDVVSMEVFYKKGERSYLYAHPYAARVCICCDSREEVDKKTEDILKRAALRDPDGENLLYTNLMTCYE